MVLDTSLRATHNTDRRENAFARHLPTAGRLLLGLLFTVFGFFGLLTYFRLVPQPEAAIPPGAAAFAAALEKTGYMVPLSSGTELIVGVLLLANRFVPLALALIAPVIVNIFLFHAFLAPSGMTIPVIIAVLEIYLAWAYRDSFRAMLAAKAVPVRPGNQ
ncbi:MAG: DoxX family protein [Armatimonadota bacterium]